MNLPVCMYIHVQYIFVRPSTYICMYVSVCMYMYGYIHTPFKERDMEGGIFLNECFHSVVVL